MKRRGSVLPSLFPLVDRQLLGILFYGQGDIPAPDSDEILGIGAALLKYHRLSALALRLIEELAIAVPKEFEEQLRNDCFEAMESSVAAVLLNSSALHELHARGIEFVVTKGPGIAHYYQHRSDRPYGDLDLVVRPDCFKPVVELLSQLGGYKEEERNVMPYKTFNLQCREALNLVGRRGGHLDIHHHIPPWRWAEGMTFEELYRGGEKVKVFGEEVVVAGSVHNMLIACLHVFSDRGRPRTNLIAWRDIVELSRVCPAGAVVDAAERVGLVGWLKWALTSLPREVRPLPILDLLRDRPAEVRSPTRLRMLMSERLTNHMASHALRLPAINGGLYLIGMLLPSRAFLAGKYPERPMGLYRRWWQDSLRIERSQ
jgi:hypothetical protein